MKINGISISEGNMKLGSIANVSLAPGRSCSAEACKTCMHEGCYAMKAYKLYKTTRAAWDGNTDAAENDLQRMEAALNKYFDGMNAPRFFRIHVGGDFISREYAEMWSRVATSHPSTNFLAFTKQWDHVRGITFPANFSLVLSAWPGCTIPDDLRKLYSVAWLDDGKTEIPENAMECPGNCITCGACWGLARMGIDVKFKKH